MEHKLTRKQAVTIVTAVIAVLLVLSLFPMRMWKRNHAVGTDAQRGGASETIAAGTAAGEYFLAQGTHLDSISFYIDSVQAGSKADVLLYSVNSENGAVTLLAKERVTLPQGSGWVTAEMDVDTTPGEQYIAYATSGTKDLTTGLDDNRNAALYSVGLQAPTEENLAYLQHAFLHKMDPESDLNVYKGGEEYDTGIDGYFLMMSFVYREPLSTKATGLLIGLILVISLLFLYAVHRFLNGAPERNKEVTVRRVLQWTLTPVILIFTASFLVLIAKGSFDYRRTDNIFYAAGFLLTALIALYGLFHKTSPADADPDGLLTFIADGLAEIFAGKGKKTTGERFVRFEELAQTALVALLLVYGCDYMNGLYEVFHTIAERRMAIVILLIILMTFRAREIFHPANLVIAIIGAAAGSWWFLHHLTGPDQYGHAYDDQSLALGIVVVVVFAITVSAMILSFLHDRKNGKNGTNESAVAPVVRTDVIVTGALAVFGIWIVLFRNMRWWSVALVVLYGFFYLRFRFWDRNRRFLTVLSNGIVLHFILTVIWCLLHRYYVSFLYIRFSMQFHTVTVTAEYLTMVEAVVMTRLLLRFMETSGKSFREKVAYVWKEAVLFGTATVYLLFTMSRTGAAAVIVMGFAVLAAVLLHEIRARRKKAFLRLIAGAAALVLSVLLMFPVVFTLQRVLPTVNRDPYAFDSIESYPDEITRGKHWNSMYFICIERFERVFASKMFGMQEMEYDYWKEYLEAHPEIDPKETSFGDYYGGQDENGKYIWLSYEDKFGETPEETVARSEALEAVEEASEESTVSAVSEESASAEETVTAVSEESASTEETVPAADTAASSPDTASETLGQEEGGGDYSNGRTTIWKAYIPNLNLTGHEGMGVPLPNGETAVHAHNTFLQAAYDFGIIGAILFVLVLLLTFVRSYGYYDVDAEEKDADRLIPFAVIAGFTAAGMVEWLFQFSNPATVILFLAIAPLTVRGVKRGAKK